MKECYFCGKTANSREHLPPTQVFKGIKVDKKNRITVPSCDEHNTSKSRDDEAIVKSMLLTLERNKNIPLAPEMETALNEVKDRYNQVKRTVTEEAIYLDYDKKIVCLNASVDLTNWIKELSAGMICYKIKCFDKNNNYKDSKVFERNSYSKNAEKHLSDFEKERNKKLKLQELSERGKWNFGWLPENPYPDTLYFFKYKFISSSILIKHVFYRSFTYYNIIEISNETKNKLL
jgi:hypothetical protein